MRTKNVLVSALICFAGIADCGAAKTADAFLPPGRMALGANYWASHAATEMWRIAGGGKVVLARDRAVAVVTDGAGKVNGLATVKGDRFLVADEQTVTVEGTATLVVCA